MIPDRVLDRLQVVPVDVDEAFAFFADAWNLETITPPCAREGGARVARLETGSVLTEALALYASTGWFEVRPFNDEPFADHWFEKALA